MDHFLYIVVAALLTILALAQIALAIHQIRKKAPDGKILLTINCVVLVIWIPLNVFHFIYLYQGVLILPLRIVWFIVAGAYMIFAFWYSNNLNKSFRK